MTALVLLCLACPTMGVAQPQADRADASEAVARRALGMLFAGDRTGLAVLYRQQLAADQAIRDNRVLRPSDAMLYLFNASNPVRDEFLLGMELAATETRNADLRTRILLSLLTDEYYELNQLKGQNRFNKFTRVFNRASSSLTKLAMFQPQDAAQLLLDGAYSMRKARTPTDRERRMIYLANAFLKKHPQAPEIAEVREFMDQVRARMETDWALREKLAGTLAMERENWDAAEFHLEKSSIINPADEETARLLREARAAGKAEVERMATAVSVSQAEKKFGAGENKVLRDGVTALLLGRPEKLSAIASGDRPRLARSAQYALASLEEAAGRHDAAVARFAALASAPEGDAPGLAVAGLLQNRGFNLDQSFEKAVAEMKEKQKKFILWGTRDSEDQAYAFGSAAIQSAGQAAAGVPMLFLTDVIVRGVAERFRTQVQVDGVVDAGARFIRRYPESPRSQQIAVLIADLSYKAGDYARSGRYMDTGGVEDPARRAKLRENEARGMLEKALAADSLAERKLRLEELLEEYGDTKISAKARKDLDKLQPTLGERSIVLTRKTLMRDPELAVAMGIHPTVLDGRRGNNEMTDQGVAIDVDRKVFSFRTRGSREYLSAALPEKDSTAIIARAVALWKSEEALQGGTQALRRQVVPLAIEGSAGGAGLEVAPKIIPYRDDPVGFRYFRQ